MSATYYRAEQIEVIHMVDRPASYADHNHVAHYTIGLVLAGHVILCCNGHATTYEQNGCFLLRPYQVHALELPERYALLSICLHKDVADECTPQWLCEYLRDTLAFLTPPIDERLFQIAAEKLCQQRKSQTQNCQTTDKLLSYNLCLECGDKVQAIAQQTFYSKFHFIKLFKQAVGLTPHRFLLQNRVRKAQRLIENDMSAADIAASLGFFDQSHFIRVFSDFVGLTPTAYKRSVKRLSV